MERTVRSSVQLFLSGAFTQSKKAYEKVALKYNTELLAASDFANPSNIDCEHLDEQGHNALARAVKDKIISIYGKAAS